MRPIDADALKDFINRQLAMTANTAVVMNAKDFFDNIVDNAPTIEPMRGKWVKHIMDYWCSECGGRVQNEQAKKLSKCPYCGALMERSEE